MALPEEEKAEIPEWIVTFGDMMSLLLTFFIMLVSMSEVKEEQLFQAVMESMRRQFGHEMSRASLVPGLARPRNAAIAKLASMGRARRLSTMNGGDKVKAPVGDYPRVKSIRAGQQVTVGAAILFEFGSAKLTKKHERLLEAAAHQVGGRLQKIKISGHTSSRPLPPNSPHEDLHELAYARCVKVKDYLVKLGINSNRIGLHQAADNEPKHIGNDPLLEKENSRVEIVLLDQLAEESSGTSEERRQRISPVRGP